MADPRVAAGPAARLRDPAPARRPEGPSSHLTVVATPAPNSLQRRRRVRLAVAAGVSAAVMVLFGLVYVHVMAAQNQLRLDQLNRHAASQQALYQRLRLQVAQLESPQHIVSTAVGRLGMQQPSSITYLAPSGPAASALVAPGAGAGPVAGDADWPQIKSQLAGSP